MNLGLAGPLPPLRGGIAHYNASLVHALRELGHTVHPVGFRRLYPPLLFPGTSEKDPDSVPFPGGEDILLAWDPRTWRRARRSLAARRIDRIVLHHWHPFFVPVLRSLARMKPPRGVVVIAHNILPHEHRRLGALLNPRLFREADLVLVGSRREGELFEQLLPGRRWHVAHHPVYDRFCEVCESLDPAEARERLDYGPSTPLLVHLGLVRRYKGVDILLEAFARFGRREIRLDVAGEFYDDEARYREQVERLHLGDRVRLVNRYLSDEEMAVRLRAADAVVLPYRHGTQSGVAMAALACGTPVIATKVGSLPEVIEPGRYGELARPGDVDSLTRALERFYDPHRAAARLDREALAREAREKYSWRAVAERVTGDFA